jgi:hypothetical protein
MKLSRRQVRFVRSKAHLARPAGGRQSPAVRTWRPWFSDVA